MREPVILDVNPDGGALAWEQNFLERLEVHVERCGGPSKEGGCPLLIGQPCGKIAHADGILFQLDLDRDDHREILKRYAQTLDVPISVVTTREKAERWDEAVRDVEVVTPPVGPARLDGFVAEVESEID